MEIRNAGPDFVWQQTPINGMPILFWPDRTICLPVLAYVGHCAKKRESCRGTIRKRVMHIREFLAFLLSRELPWSAANDGLLEDWRTERLTGLTREEMIRRTVTFETKVNDVFQFYASLPSAMPFHEDGSTLMPFVDYLVRAPIHMGEASSGDALNPHMAPITSKSIGDPSDGRRRWSGASRIAQTELMRPIPSMDVVNKLETAVRSEDPSKSMRRRGISEAMAIALSERRFLQLRCGSELGLRRAEIAGISLNDIMFALKRVGIQPPVVGGCDGIHPLDACAQSEPAQSELLAKLEILQATRREFMALRTLGKGSKLRDVPISFRAMERLLVVGVWGFRAIFIAHMKKSQPLLVPPPELFLSLKTGGALSPGSVGDFAKDAFKSIGQPHLSGHSIRAAAATEEAIQLVEKYCLDVNGVPGTHGLDIALMNLSRWLGHANMSTTARFYIDFAFVWWEGRRRSNPRVVQLLQQTRESLPLLDEAGFDLVIRVVNKLVQEGPDKNVARVLRLLVHPGEQVLGAVAAGRNPAVQVVASN